MVNTKVVLALLIFVSILVTAVAGIAFAQFANAQPNESMGVAGQVSQVGYGYYPKQGYSSQGGAQYGGSYGYGHGMGTGMCGRFW